jgi:dolichol kinase
MHLSFSFATSAMIMLEYHRYFNIWPLGGYIEPFLSRFMDSKDAGPAILAHIYLIIGCALPVWIMGFGRMTCCMAGTTGIVVIGVGDSMVFVQLI